MQYSRGTFRKFCAAMLFTLLFLSAYTFIVWNLPHAHASSITELEVLPNVVSKTDLDFGTFFNVTIAILNVTDLWGFDINVTWGNSLITFVEGDYVGSLNFLWPGGWYLGQNTTGLNGNTCWYRLVATSTNTGFTNSGTQGLFTLEFCVFNPQMIGVSQTTLHFSTDKLSNSQPGPIGHTTMDGQYSMTVNSYNLTTTTVGSGSLSLNNTGPYHYGDNVLLTAVPSTGWSFSLWGGDLFGSANPALLSIVGNASVTATFIQSQYILTVTTLGGGSVNSNNTGPFHYGDVVQLTGIPNVGWLFDHWSGDGSGSVNPINLNFTRSLSITAIFVQINYTLNISVIGSGTVNSNNTGPYHYGDVVQLTAVPAVGWGLSSWGGNLSGFVNPTTLSIFGNTSVSATFVIVNYSLTVNVIGHGDVYMNNTGPYVYGDVVQLTAVPHLGWSFLNWSGNLVGQSNPGTIVIIGNMVVNATFVGEDLYVLTIASVGSGSVNKNPNQTAYYHGTIVTLTATPSAGWTFAGWSGDTFGTTNPTTINMAGDRTVIATFTKNVYTLSLSYLGMGNIVNNNSQTLAYGDVVSLWPYPSADWVFQYWSGDFYGSSNPANVFINGNFSITAHFTLKPSVEITPPNYTCRTYMESFSMTISISNVLLANGFCFDIRYNSSLLAYAGVAWNTWSSGSITVNASIGNIMGSTGGFPLGSGSHILLTLTFASSFYHVWKNAADWPNDLTSAVYFEMLNVSYPAGAALQYFRGNTSQVDVNPDFSYTFSPIQGDVNNDGTVDLFDLRAASAFVGVARGDSLWSNASTYDLNGDGVVNSSDLGYIGSNFGYTYVP